MSPAQLTLGVQQGALGKREGGEQLFQEKGYARSVEASSNGMDFGDPTSTVPKRPMSLVYPPREVSKEVGGKERAKTRSIYHRDDSGLQKSGSRSTHGIPVDALDFDHFRDVEQVQLEEVPGGNVDGADYRLPPPAGTLRGHWTAAAHGTRRFDDDERADESWDAIGRCNRRDSGESSEGSSNNEGDATRLKVSGKLTMGVRDWARVPGDTSITYGARLYMSNLDPDLSHEENCEGLLRQILERIATEELNVPALKMRHLIKVEAFLQSVAMSVPSKTWHQSVRGALSMSSPVAGRKSPGNGHQISQEELLFRMTLFVAMMRAEREGTSEADAKLDPMRVETVVRAYTASAAEVLALQRPARRILPRLLFCIACELLTVRLLAPEVRSACHQVVSDFEGRAKLWMSPQLNGERYLGPLVMELIKWIRSNREALVRGSATEGLLKSIDRKLRATLKHQIYRSPEHFLAVLESLKEQLTDAPLPSYDPCGGDEHHPFDVSQTLKDVRREKFHVNGQPTAPGECWGRIRSDLARGTMGEGLGAVGSDPVESGLGEGCGKSLLRTTGTTRTRRPTQGSGIEPRGKGDAGAHGDGRGAKSHRYRSREDGRGGGRDGAGVSKESVAPCGDAAAGQDQAQAKAAKEQCGRANGKTASEMYVDQCAWRVLHAASRTASGGDSFFVVQDLFGGEGILVKSSRASTEPIDIRTKGTAVKVMTVDKYDIYHASDVDIHSSTSDSCPQPLITITTTMKEVIHFAPYRDILSKNQLHPSKSSACDETSGKVTAEKAAVMQLPHAKSSRFITIAASLPVVEKDHLDSKGDRSGTSSQSSQSPRSSRSWRRERSFGGGCPVQAPGLPRNGSLGSISAGCNPSLRRSISAPTGVALGCLVRRPSAPVAPEPELVPGGWRRQSDSSSEGADVDGDRSGGSRYSKDETMPKPGFR